jgi:hypothetical protein
MMKANENAVLVHTSCDHGLWEKVNRHGEYVCSRCGQEVPEETPEPEAQPEWDFENNIGLSDIDYRVEDGAEIWELDDNGYRSWHPRNEAMKILRNAGHPDYQPGGRCD